jgi:hypothetical protein
MLHVALALNRGADSFVELVPHQACQHISLGEAFVVTFAMVVRTASDVSGDTGLERAVGTVRHDVDPAAAHLGNGTSSGDGWKDVDGRVKPTAVRQEFCLLRRTALILLVS